MGSCALVFYWRGYFNTAFLPKDPCQHDSFDLCSTISIPAGQSALVFIVFDLDLEPFYRCLLLALVQLEFLESLLDIERFGSSDHRRIPVPIPDTELQIAPGDFQCCNLRYIYQLGVNFHNYSSERGEASAGDMTGGGVNHWLTKSHDQEPRKVSEPATDLFFKNIHSKTELQMCPEPHQGTWIYLV